MEGYRVIEACDGVGALKKVGLTNPNIILLDVKMPRLDGWEVCKQLKTDERTKNIPIIIITAFSQLQDQKKSLEVGANAFFTKPIEIAALLNTIHNLLEKES